MKKKWTILYYMVVPDELVKPYTLFIENVCATLAASNNKDEISVGFYIYKLYFQKETGLPIYAGLSFFPPITDLNYNFFKIENGTIIPFEPGDVNCLQHFFREGKEKLDADDYYINIWGHGGGYFTFTTREKELASFIKDRKAFYLESPQLSDITNLVTKEDFINDNKSFFRVYAQMNMLKKSMLPIFSEDKLDKNEQHLKNDPTKPVIFMHRRPRFPNTITMLAAEEVSAAVLSSGINPEKTIIQFSSCLMQNIETAYQLSKCCKYLIASQDYLYPIDITNCFELMGILNKDLSATEICNEVINNFKNANTETNPKDQCRCISLIETNQLKLVETFLSNIIEKVISNPDYFSPIIKNARAACSNFADDDNGITTDDLKLDLIDFVWFFKCLEKQLHLHLHPSAPAFLVPFLFDVQNLISISEKSVLNKLVKENRGINLSSAWCYGGHGLNISFPKDLERAKLIAPVFVSIYYSRSINKLDFFEKFKWMEFVELAYK